MFVVLVLFLSFFSTATFAGNFVPSGSCEEGLIVKLNERARFQLPKPIVNQSATALSSNGETFAYAASDGVVRVYSAHTGTLLLELDQSFGYRSPTSDFLSIVGLVSSGLLASSLFQQAPEMVTALTFSPDSQLLAVGLHNGSIIAHDLNQAGHVIYNVRGRFQRHLDWVAKLAFSLDSQLLASASYAEPIIVHDLQNKNRKYLRGHTDPVYALSFYDDHTLYVSAFHDRREGQSYILEFDARSGVLKNRIPIDKVTPQAITESPMERALHKISDGQEAQILPSSSSTRIITMGADYRTIQIFEVQTH